MYATFLIVSVLSYTNVGVPHRPAIAEKAAEVHWPAIAEMPEGRLEKLPPEKWIPVLAPQEFNDLRDKFPIKTGMTKADVTKAVKEHPFALPLSREKYYLVGGRPMKNLSNEPWFVWTAGRGDFFCLVSFKESRVECIWCQLVSGPHVVGPPFVLQGDPKYRKAVQKFFFDWE